VAGSVRVARDNGVATVILENVERRNAISVAMWRELARVFTAFAEEGDSLRAAMVRGAPSGGAFSAGADLSEFPEVRGTTEAALAYRNETHTALDALFACPVPVLALIDGPCMGGGLEVALCADLRLGTERSTFSLPITRLSNAAELQNICRLAGVAGPGLAAEILLSAGSISAERAYSVGLLNWLGSIEALDDAAQGFVARILAGAPAAVRLAKQGLRTVQKPTPGADEAYEQGMRRVLSGRDFHEGTRAFLERRKPAFTGE
jgi:enoyl-CoA hydratase/carnithine racemase